MILIIFAFIKDKLELYCSGERRADFQRSFQEKYETRLKAPVGFHPEKEMFF